MKPTTWAVSALLLATTACAGARGPVAPTPQPTPATPPAGAPAQPPTAPGTTPAPSTPTARSGPAGDWHLLDPATDGVPGTAAARALRELLQNAAPKRRVVVAVIDGGVDTAHTALRGALWLNPKERPGNRADDDGNGYVDDVRGWNFIGGADGRNVDHERLELTRLVAGCRAGQTSPIATVPCQTLELRLDSARAEALQNQQVYRSIKPAMDSAVATLARALNVPPDSVTLARVEGASVPASAQRARQQFLFLARQGATPENLKEGLEHFDDQLTYDLNPTFDPRGIVGDTPAAGRRYGNADVTGPDAGHGTHVAGIIAAAAGQEPGQDGARGIAPGVVILPVRAVPNGDERDKDVANAIRYAVDQGANIINMSFGKAYSPQKATVDSAVRYAESKGVLLVHAAGNDGQDADRDVSFPTPEYAGGQRATTWLEVGASSWEPARLAARFSNYGKRRVDLFAPGVDILSAKSGGGWVREDGTSMAAPVVSGVAALLMAHFPTLTAADVRRILLATVTPQPGRTVPRPGADGLVPFADLSVSGGIVNAYEAVRMAQRETATRP